MSLGANRSQARRSRYARVLEQVASRVQAIMCRARLACRSPPRDRRCRLVLPLDAGMCATPHSAAPPITLKSMRPSWRRLNYEASSRWWSLIQTMPVSSRPATRCARATSRVQIAEPRPKLESLAVAMGTASSSKRDGHQHGAEGLLPRDGHVVRDIGKHLSGPISQPGR
jgi:hypothetical protein